MLKLAGVDQVLTITTTLFSADVHRVFEGKFHNLIPYDIYADYLQNSNIVKCKADGEGLALCAPDAGAREFVREMFNRIGLPQGRVHPAGQGAQR